MKAQIQRLGGFMAGMVIPNIGAFIAWGLITSLFIPPGWMAKWFGEDSLDYQFITDNTVGPMIKYLLPLLIAYTGGKMIYGHRGGVLGAIAVMGVIGGSLFEITSGAFAGASGAPPQFLGAMIVGPMSGWLMKKIDAFLEPRTPAGFEMLYNNFSQGILGLVLAMIGFWAIGPVMAAIAIVFGSDPQRNRRCWFAPAHGHSDRGWQGAVPEQRHQPWNLDSVGCCRSGRNRQVDLLPT